MRIHCLEAPWEAGKSIESWRDGLCLCQRALEKKWGESKRKGERKRAASYFMSLSPFNRADERGEKGKESV